MYFHEIVIVINIVDNIIYKSEREVFLIFTLFFVRRRAVVSDMLSPTKSSSVWLTKTNAPLNTAQFSPMINVLYSAAPHAARTWRNLADGALISSSGWSHRGWLLIFSFQIDLSMDFFQRCRTYSEFLYLPHAERRQEGCCFAQICRYHQDVFPLLPN